MTLSQRFTIFKVELRPSWAEPSSAQGKCLDFDKVSTSRSIAKDSCDAFELPTTQKLSRVALIPRFWINDWARLTQDGINATVHPP
jgi:hypothetical protein